MDCGQREARVRSMLLVGVRCRLFRPRITSLWGRVSCMQEDKASSGHRMKGAEHRSPSGQRDHHSRWRFEQTSNHGQVTMKTLIAMATATMLCGCASQLYRDTPESRLTGKLDVRWVENDYFLFVPNISDPLRIERTGKDAIQPGFMYTDGGSIPRALWGVEGLSPWGYAPAYIVHDWLFEAHRCGYVPDDRYTFDDSVDVLAEALKAIMEDNPKVRNYFIFDSVVAAVGSPIAKKLWNEGKCNPPPADEQRLRTLYRKGHALPGELLLTIEYK